jgi:hypothetical protein
VWATAAADARQADLVAARHQVSVLADQLKAQQGVIDQEGQLLAEGRDVRDLMGARNLHIIDVHVSTEYSPHGLIPVLFVLGDGTQNPLQPLPSAV